MQSPDVAVAAAPIQRVRGTNDVLPPDDARLRALEASLRAHFESFGYQGVETPILEPLELFLRKSGDEIVARMYAFSHWNRRLCLRPEHTASVMRLFVNELQGRSLPLRLHYAGPEFRYERPSRGRYRQFTAVGLELIGASGPAADAEVLHLALAGLAAAGVRNYRLVVGHLGIVLQMLAQLGLGEHAQGLVLDYLEPLARGRLSAEAAVARIADLLGAGTGRDSSEPNGAGDEDDGSPLSALPPDQAAAVAADLMRRMSLPLEGGSRTPRQIVERLLARGKRTDPTEHIRAAIDFVLELHAAAGPLDHLDRLRAVASRHGLNTAPLDQVESALRLLRAYGADETSVPWEVDLSLARGLRYYTGLVFEVYVDTADGLLQVCGGGRYDELIRALGGREVVPACGFSYGLERVDLAIQQPAPEAESARRPRVLVVALGAPEYPASLALARDLRVAGGLVVEQDVRQRGVKSALRYADRSGADAVVMLGPEELSAGEALVRFMHTRHEHRAPLTDVARALREGLA